MITVANIDPAMIANNLTPFEPTHPGELIRDELKARNLSQAKLANQIGISPSLLNEVINGSVLSILNWRGVLFRGNEEEAVPSKNLLRNV